MADLPELLVFSGSGSPALTAKVCDYLGIPQGKGEVLHFPEGNLFVRISENVRGRHIYLIQSIAFPPNDNSVTNSVTDTFIAAQACVTVIR